MSAEGIRRNISRMARAVLAELGIVTVHEYRVVSQAGALVNLQAVRRSVGLPDLERVPTRAPAGYVPKYRLGSTVLVGFVEGDEARPFVAHGPEVSSAAPLEVALDADAIKLGAALATVLRDGDKVLISPGNGSGPVSGTITLTNAPPLDPDPSKVKA